MNVLFVQPALPQYRVPFFTELQRHAVDGVPIRVRVWCDYHHPLLPHSDPGDALETAHRPETPLGPFLSQPALLEAVLDPWPDVVVLSWNTRYVQLSPALVAARLRGRALLLWGHGYSKRYSYWKHRTRNLFGHLAHACVTYSEGVQKRLTDEGLAREKVFCAPNALDAAPLQRHREYWRSDPQGLRQLREQLGIDAGPVLLFVSRLESDKRVDLLLQSFSKLTSRGTAAQLIIVGGGTELAPLQTLAEQLGIAPRIRFLGPIYDERTLAGIFASSTAFVYPVAVGLSVLHALNYGVPVITSNNPDCHNPEFDVLVHDRNSLLYRHEDDDDLTRMMERIVEDRELHARLAAGALESTTGAHGRNLQTMASGMVSALTYAHRAARGQL